MEKVLLKSIIFAIYFLLLSMTLGFKLNLIINLPMLAVVIIGTALLTFLNLLKGIDNKKLNEKIKWNLMVTGYLTTFLAQLALFSEAAIIENMYVRIVSNFLPIFYSLLLYLAIDIFSSIAPIEAAAIRTGNNIFLQLEGMELTKREIMIAQELIKDASNKDISSRLFISENTVKKHVQNIFRKANVRNRTEFIMLFTTASEVYQTKQKDLDASD